MGFLIPPHTPYLWQDLPSQATPLDSANLATAETDLVNYTQTALGAYDTFAEARFLSGTQSAGGNLGSAFTVDFGSTPNDAVVVTGVLNADCTVTLANQAPGCRVRLLFSQDTVGGHALTISDGFNIQAIQVPTSPNASFAVDIECPNATDLYILPITGGSLVPLTNRVTPAYSTSITPDLNQGTWQTITVNNNTAFTINAPAHPPDLAHSAELVIEVLNSSGGAMGVITWDAAFVFANGTWTNPANTKYRFVRFEWNGIKWIGTSAANTDYS